jgi:CRISPR-associated endonuclease/helicase Cas3
MNYREFFAVATGGLLPFRFQERFHEEGRGRVILRAPTGLGKTDTAIVSWLHRRAVEPESTPRRLVWCLPGRALTEQVASVAESRIHRLVDAGLLAPVRVCRLLGGSLDNDLTLAPDDPAILVGTQDILLSRALNRGYARRPFRWPIDFALLNNDCQWVLDEVQLLGDGLATSTQLAAFREQFGCFGSAPTWWISATFDPAWLHTVDFASLAADMRVIEPEVEDLENEVVQLRVHAEKRVEAAPLECRLPAGVAEFVSAQHRPKTLSLVIANTVRRAVEIRAAIEKKVSADVRLLHSRFRAADRAAHVAAVQSPAPPEGRILIATQVIEAGIDLDATLLVTDVAPYSSLVQRFGRVNRYGKQDGCRILWVDRPLTSKRKSWAGAGELKPKENEQVCLPYAVNEIEKAVRILEELRSAAPADLPPVSSPPPWEHVLRRADILDLFDTSSDLGGNEVDISRFVRSSGDRDVYVAWRDWPDGGRGQEPLAEMKEIEEAELCPAPIGYLREIAKESAWCWNAVATKWERPRVVYPGLTLLMHTSEGRYSAELGWSPESGAPVTSLEPSSGPTAEGQDDDRKSFVSYRQSLEDHTQQVYAEMGALIAALGGLDLEPYRSILESAARYHDWGKAHPVMQETLHKALGPYAEILAKQERGKAAHSHSRRFFRHELASAFAMLAEGESDLAAYVVAAHHGRVRVSIRSMPGERNMGRDCVHGIEEGDVLLGCSLGSGIGRAATRLTLAATVLGRGEDGGSSWTDRVLRLRDGIGPFRLAYLEMLMRAADERASAKAGEGVK